MPAKTNSELTPAWRHRNLRVLVIGEGVSTFGSLVARLALPWTAARELHRGTLEVGLVFLAELLPAALLGLFAGVVVDRMSRRRVLVLSNIALAGVTAVIPLLAWAHRLSISWIYAIGFVSGCIVPFFRAAFRSTVPITVPRDALQGAQAVVQGVSATAELLAFAAAGWLVHLFGGPAGLAIDAATFVWAGAASTLLPPTPPALRKQDRSAVLQELREGTRFVRNHAVLGPVAVAQFFGGLGVGVIGSVIIVHITTTLGYETGPQGVVYAVGGAASLATAAVAPRLSRRIGLHTMLIAPLLLVVPATALIAFAPRPSVRGYAMLVGQQLIADPAGTLSLIAFGTVIAASAPDAMRGRVESTVMVLATLGTAIGFVLGGLLGEPSRLGSAATLMAGAAAGALGAAFLVAPQLRTLRHIADI